MFSNHNCSILHIQINVIERQQSLLGFDEYGVKVTARRPERAHILSSVECCQDVLCTAAGYEDKLLRMDARLGCVLAGDLFSGD